MYQDRKPKAMTMTSRPREVVVERNDSDEGSENNLRESENENEASDEGSSIGNTTGNDVLAGENGNLGWADSIARILRTNKPKGKHAIVLAKAKKITGPEKQTTKTKLAGFEVETADGKVKQEKVEIKEENVEVRPSRIKKKELPSLRVKPNIREKDRERTLSKIATRGVVQLFNAVRMQQKDISRKLEEAGPLEVKKDKVMKSIDKRAFLDVLMGEKSEEVDEPTSKKHKIASSTEDSTWSVLRDDFMMGAKLKDWDKEMEEEVQEQEREIDMESE